MKIDPAQMEDEKTYKGLNKNGGCVTGCGNKQYAFHDLFHELLKCNPEKLTITLDCCRSAVTRCGDRFVKLQYVKQLISYYSL